MELKPRRVGSPGASSVVLIVPFMELKPKSGSMRSTGKARLNRTFYGIETIIKN